jgi:hypothetical protein
MILLQSGADVVGLDNPNDESDPPLKQVRLNVLKNDRDFSNQA